MLCTLTTDFGTRDWYVGALKGTLLRLAPTVTLVDLSHDIAPGDIVAASWVLAGAATTFPAHTLHLAVVDPGVGSARRILVANGGGHTFIAPDNGLLTAVLDAGAVAHAVDRPDLHLDAPGETFHGRDRFAPIAAAILGGESLDRLGPRIDHPMRLTPERPTRDAERGTIVGSVIHIDRYGNLITDVPAEWIRGHRVSARAGALVMRQVATHYAALEPGIPALLIGSLGTLEIALRDHSAAESTGIRRGDAVTIELDAPRR